MRKLHLDVSPGAWISFRGSGKILNLCYLSRTNITAVGPDCAPHIICRVQKLSISTDSYTVDASAHFICNVSYDSSESAA
jgi:hypothetical protein